MQILQLRHVILSDLLSPLENKLTFQLKVVGVKKG